MTEMEKTFLTRMIAWTALLLIFALPSPAQWVNYKTPGIPRPPDGKPNLSAPAPRTADGRPDISGIWRVRHPPQSGWLDELGRLKGGWRLLPGFPQSAPWFQSVSSYLPTWSGTSKPLPKTH